MSEPVAKRVMLLLSRQTVALGCFACSFKLSGYAMFASWARVRSASLTEANPKEERLTSLLTPGTRRDVMSLRGYLELSVTNRQTDKQTRVNMYLFAECSGPSGDGRGPICCLNSRKWPLCTNRCMKTASDKSWWGARIAAHGGSSSTNKWTNTDRKHV